MGEKMIKMYIEGLADSYKEQGQELSEDNKESFRKILYNYEAFRAVILSGMTVQK
jgi:hypothetical protein